MTILLGTLFDGQIPVLGIALANLLGGGLITSFIPQLLFITPWILPKVTSAKAAGLALPVEMAWLPVAFSLV